MPSTRGSEHGTNEYPFLIDEDGMSILPITSLELGYGVSKDRMSTGIKDLDTMLGGKGYIRGSSVLISGPAGNGQNKLCFRGVPRPHAQGRTRVVPRVRGVRGPDRPQYALHRHRPRRWIRRASCPSMRPGPRFKASRCISSPSHKLVDREHPDVVVIDPMSNLGYVGDSLAYALC